MDNSVEMADIKVNLNVSADQAGKTLAKFQN
jgi:hypothetical protein